MKVDFHILEEATCQRSWHYACQLIEKAYTDNRKVFIYLNSSEEAERMDTLLWTFREDSFIPHNVYNANDDSPPPVQIGHGAKPQHHQDILLNLSRELPAFFAQFTQVIEIVFSDPHVQQLARERYKQYRDQNCELNTFKIKANEL